jgi:hypothetical protein
MDKLIQKDYKPCPCCKNWFSKKSKYKHSWCSTCKEKKKKEWKELGKSNVKKNDVFICQECKEEKNYRCFNRNSYEICKKCKFWKTQLKDGKRRCHSCMSWFPEEHFLVKKHCQKCQIKNNEWNREKNRRDRADPLKKDRFKEYCRKYYYNTFKPIYNKVLNLQFAYGLCKPRKINRKGYWYVLNHAFHTSCKRNFRSWISETTQVIEFLKTGRGTIVGDRVVLNGNITRKEFNEYLDSDEAMNSSIRPKFEEKEIPIREYFNK